MGKKYNMDNNFVVTLYPSHIKWRWINIPAPYRCLFPDINKAPITLNINGTLIETKLRLHKSRKHNLAGDGLTDWFKAHPELKEGDKVHISVIEPMKNTALK
jgi:hypothetical protein